MVAVMQYNHLFIQTKYYHLFIQTKFLPNLPESVTSDMASVILLDGDGWSKVGGLSAAPATCLSSTYRLWHD